MPRVDLNMKQPEQAINTNVNLEEKLQENEVIEVNSKLVNDNSEVNDKSKKQSADMQLPLDILKVHPLKIKQLEQAIDGKACLEEKLQKSEGTEVINRDEKICIGTTVDLDGKRKASLDKKMKHSGLEEVTPSKKTMRKRSIDIMEDCETGKAVFDETTGAEEIPTKSPCAKCLYDVQNFSKNLRAWRNDYNIDTIESSILALEELINKIQWINGVMQFGMKWETSRKPSWQFSDGPEALSWE